MGEGRRGENEKGKRVVFGNTHSTYAPCHASHVPHVMLHILAYTTIPYIKLYSQIIQNLVIIILPYFTFIKQAETLCITHSP